MRSGFPFKLLLAISLISTTVAGEGCKRSNSIPGTEIPDTEENREILQVLERYRTAFVRRDAAAVLAVAHDTYYDEFGTDKPSDDVVYQRLTEKLKLRFAQLDSVRFTMEYRDITIEKNRALVYVWIDASFTLKPILDSAGNPRLSARANSLQDFARFELVRVNDSWLITKGI